jgi:hypothetical protein
MRSIYQSLTTKHSSLAYWEEIAMLLRKLVVVGLVGIAALAANVAIAEDTPTTGGAAAGATIGADDISFADPLNAFSAENFSIDIGLGAAPRFASFTPSEQGRDARDSERRYEVAVVARDVGGIEVAFAQRGGVGFDDDGELTSERRGSELRLGRGLSVDEDQPSDQPTWYVFAASEDEALTWRPGVRNEFGGTGSSFGLQQRVEIGDMQAGITYERNGWQASFAYVEREISSRNGSRTVYQDESFTGVTLTLRH